MKIIHRNRDNQTCSFTQRERVIFANSLDVRPTFEVAQPSGKDAADWNGDVKKGVGVRKIAGQDQVDHYNTALKFRLDNMRTAVRSQTKQDLADFFKAEKADSSGTALEAEKVDSNIIGKMLPVLDGLEVNLGTVGTDKADRTLKAIAEKAVKWKGGTSEFAQLVKKQSWYTQNEAAFKTKDNNVIRTLQNAMIHLIIARANREGYNVDYLVPGMRLAYVRGHFIVLDKANRQAAPDIDDQNPTTIEGRAVVDRRKKYDSFQSAVIAVRYMQTVIRELEEKIPWQQAEISKMKTNLDKAQAQFKDLPWGQKQLLIGRAGALDRYITDLTERIKVTESNLSKNKQNLATEKKNFSDQYLMTLGFERTYNVAKETAKKYGTESVSEPVTMATTTGKIDFSLPSKN